MKAAIFHEFGGPEVLRIEDVPVPEIGPDEALVRVRAAGLNRLDLMMRAGHTPVKPILPHISGSEVAGELVKVGENIKDFTPGQHVAIAPYLHDGTCVYCLRGEETTCLNGEILGLRTDGGHAEFVVVPGNSLVAMPEELSFEDAAAQTFTTITAWHMLVTKAGIHPGETVLVLAAGSGVGVAAIQIAKLWGARVIATSSRDENLQKALELGADEVINYAERDFSKEARAMTDRLGVDVVVEHVGSETWDKSMASVARNGRVVVCGSTTGSGASLQLSTLFSRQIMVIGSYGGTREDLAEVLRLTADGRLKAIIDRTYPLDEIQAAQEYLDSRKQFGKIIFTP
ncbi:MAG TPA: zinc-binding dehydrogenase [Chloroflexia bacterium]|nr:zinc-binding dehydrogenase [Chloroflexia bacterium]